MKKWLLRDYDSLLVAVAALAALTMLFLAARISAQSVRFEPGFSGCVDVVVTTTTQLSGVELGLQYSGLQAPRVARGADLPADGFFVINAAPPSSCPDQRPGLAIGLVTGAAALSPGEYRLLELCFSPPANPASLCGALDLVDCLGDPPILNRSFPGPVDLVEEDGEACFLPRPFRRGDLDGDGAQSIQDAIDILHCLFLQSRCPGCFDAADANDDGFADISDVVFLLGFRVGLVAMLPPPAIACGEDTTLDPFLCPDVGAPACAWAELRWDPPTINADGTPLDDLAGYRIYAGREETNLVLLASTDAMSSQPYMISITDPTPGRMFFAVTAVDLSGNESGFSKVAWKEF